MLLIFLFFIASLTDITALLPDNIVLTQTIKGDCTGDEKEEIILVYDINSRFGTDEYRGTCVSIYEQFEGEFQEVYKTRLSADTKIRFAKILDELPPFVEIQWFHAAGGGNTYIAYDKELKRFREILNFESGGLNKEDINSDGKEEIFSFTFEPVQCNGEINEIYASFLTFFRWKKNSFESFPESPYMMRPGTTYFATSKAISTPKLLVVSQPRYPSLEFRGVEDCSFTLFAARDANKLFLLLVIKDDIIIQQGEGKDLIHGDHIVLLIDSDIANDFCKRTLDDDDIALALSPGNFHDVSPDIINLNPLSVISKNIVQNTDFLFEKQTGGYKVRITIEIDREILDRRTLGFGIIIYDRDRENVHYPEFRMSWPSTINKKDPTTWGNLYLFSPNEGYHH